MPPQDAAQLYSSLLNFACYADGGYAQKFLLSLDSPSSFPDHHHGRFRFRLGLSIILRSSRFRPLVFKGMSLAYQCKGVTSSFHRPPSRDVHSFICSPQSVRQNSPPRPPMFDLPVRYTPGRPLEQVGRRLVPPSVLIIGVASQAVPLCTPHTPLRNSPNRSILDKMPFTSRASFRLMREALTHLWRIGTKKVIKAKFSL